MSLHPKPYLTITLPITWLLILTFNSGCLKIENKSKKNNPDTAPTNISQTDPKAPQNIPPTPPAKELVNEPLKLCVRPAHYVGLKKCVRTGKWIRMSLSAQDVDNDRTDVFTEPGMSLLKHNFFPETFRIEHGVHHITNYPDQYRSNAPYAGDAHFVFAVPQQVNPDLHFSYWGRDESYSQKVHLSEIPNMGIKYVKIQHWNDGRAYKKHANLQVKIIGDYHEINYRYQCAWMEIEQGLDYSQEKTKEGLLNPRIPETLAWRKITEKCENIPTQFKDPNINLHPFSDVSPQQLLSNHTFKNDSKKIKRLYPKTKELFENEDFPFELANPLPKFAIKLDGSTPFFKNYRGEEILKIEGLYDEDLKDKSFNPQRLKD